MNATKTELQNSPVIKRLFLRVCALFDKLIISDVCPVYNFFCRLGM